MEKSDFDKLVGRIEAIAEHIRKSEKVKSQDQTERWLSSEEAMDILGVSPRTLQRYRDTGRIPLWRCLTGRNSSSKKSGTTNG